MLSTRCQLFSFRADPKLIYISILYFFFRSGQGIRENLRLIQEFYPGWIMRLYYDVGNKDDDDGDGAFVMSQLCQIACSEPMFDLCEASHNARLGNASILYPLLWRFLPAMDIQVSGLYVCSRRENAFRV